MSNTARSGVFGSSNIEARFPERKSWGIMGSGVKKEEKRKFWGR
jgi:hypothetical protein